jgi:precorrin-6Y C5,15-methyltransferase (decarboxylating)
MTAGKIHIIGIGDDGFEGLTATTRGLIERAELLLGSEQTFRRIPAGSARRVTIGTDLNAALDAIRSDAAQRIVVLASGDPLFYGVARFLCEKLGKDRFEVVPHVSSMQLAFARVKESWEEAYLTDLANSPLERVLDAARVAERVGLFTSETVTPAIVAQALLDNKIGYFHGYVCENLGAPDERVTHGELADLARQTFAPLNVMILIRRPNVPDRPSEGGQYRLFGNPDDAFLQSRPKYGLLTTAEIRSIALAQLDVRPTSTVWDVGAGSGSVAVEAAQIAAQGKVYAIEMDADDCQLIQSNAQRFGVKNLQAVHGRAPEAWANLPEPDRIFVGGSGRQVGRIVELAFQRLAKSGRLVANVGSIENLAALNESLAARSPDVQVWMINVARGKYQLERVRFEAINPSFLIAVSKPGV